MAKADMPELLKNITAWLTTSGMKILGILIVLIVLSQMSKWIVKWLERFLPEKDTLQAIEAKKRAHPLGNILRHAVLIVISFIALLIFLGELGIQLGPLLATAGIGAVPVGFGAQSLVKERRRIKIRFDEKGIQIPFPPPVLIWEDRKQRNEEGRVMNVEFHF